MANRDSPQKRAMDEKLARVWTAPAQGADSSSGTTIYHSMMSPEQLTALQPQQDEAVFRVFQSLRTA